MNDGRDERRGVRPTHTACVLGAGNAAHVTAGLIAALPDWQCRVFAPRKDRAERWRSGALQHGMRVTFEHGQPNGRGEERYPPGQEVVGWPTLISKYAAEVVPGCEVLLLCVPAHAADEVLRAVAPHVDQGALIGSLGGSSGVDWCVDAAMAEVGRKPESYGVFSFVNLPWVCRITTYGRAVRIKAIKPHMRLAVRPTAHFAEASALLDRVVGSPSPRAAGGFLEVGLANICQVIHPCVMYDNFGPPQPGQVNHRVFPQAPLFYQGLSSRGAALIDAASSELMTVRDALEARLPGVQLGEVRHVRAWLTWAYGPKIRDRSSLQAQFQSNTAYAGLTCPMRATPVGLRPDFEHRYLAEDVPCNLVALRGLAELVAVPTPTIDLVIEWAQDALRMELLVNGRVGGADLHRTLAPQRFGVRTVEQLQTHISTTSAAGHAADRDNASRRDTDWPDTDWPDTDLEGAA